MRNGWPSFRGGYYSRAGTAFVGFSKQTGRSVAPRMIPFQFSINQGLALEFGNFYMRVVKDGGYVLENPFAVTGATNAKPPTITYAALSTAQSVIANLGAVTASYARGDQIQPAGGVNTTPAVFTILTTTLASLALNAPGTGYLVGDQVTLNDGGSFSLAPVITVTGVGGGGAITTFGLSNGGVWTLNGTGNFTQSSSTGAGTGATFKSGVWGPLALQITNPGSYSTVPANPANQGFTSGGGVGATYSITWATPAALANSDWLFFSGIGGMIQLNNQTYVIGNLTATTFQLFDVYGNPIDATAFGAYTSGGNAARIFTLATIYAEADLRYLKFTQSADVMSLCCVNQITAVEYPAQDMSRISDTNWTFSAVVPTPTVLPPTNLAATASGAGSWDYLYAVTSVGSDGTESVPTTAVAVAAAVAIASTAGAITLTWTMQPGINEYNVYKASPVYNTPVPAGALLGYAGTVYGGSLVDSNIVPDFIQVPPQHQNPFARGQIIGWTITNGGAGTNFTPTLHSVTGSGAKLTAIDNGTVLTGFIIVDPGQNYQPGDTVTLDQGATATLKIGPEMGTYPSVPGYFQERRCYGNTLNNPDTYFMSSPGSFTNFDTRIPTIDSDAITGSPWSVQVNGIQWFISMPGGLIVMTGLSLWQLTGSGGSSLNPQPITPKDQTAQAQAFNGVSPTVPPIKIDYQFLYVQAKGSIYRADDYNFYANIYTGTDITINSPQLFEGFTILEHAWCEEPYRLLWAVRSDGVLLSLTWLKPEQVAGWARHDTQGTFVTCCSVTEPPVDALYVGVQRQFGSNTAYVIERMDNRIWSQAETVWAVDCGFTLAQPQPNATLTPASANGLGSVTGATNIVGGTGYSAGAIGTVIDAPAFQGGPVGPGTGAVPTLTFVGGVLTNVTFSGGNRGSNYLNPQLLITDPAGSAGGSGASATLTLNTSATMTASAAVFTAPNVGNVIRCGGGMASITAVNSPTSINVNMLSPIVAVIGGLQTGAQPTPQSFTAGNWTMTAPVSTVSVPQLAGATVTGLADGNVITPQVVPANGTVTLPAASTAVTVGLGFQAQLQSVYLDVAAGSETVQGQRKLVAAANVRMQASRGIKMGSNQRDGSTLSPPQIAPAWTGMDAVPDIAPKPYNAVCVPLFTGDVRIPTPGGWGKPGQIALQQDNPLPMQVLSIEPELLAGDSSEQKVQARERRQQRAA